MLTGRSGTEMRNLFNGFYADKSVMVTGHTGFKGAWLTFWLYLMGAKVTGYSLVPNTEPSLFKAIKLQERINHVIGDILDLNNVRKVMLENSPEIVFHLAAQPLVRYSYREPRLTYETNVLGTVNILEAVRSVKSVRACIVITSDKCYENREWDFAYRENDTLGGIDPYSSSKACQEMVVTAYSNSFFRGNGSSKMALSTVRSGNVIGGGDWAVDRIVPDVVRALSESKPVLVRNPHAVRPWQYVLEPLAGYLWLAFLMYCDMEKYNSAWNFGPDNKANITVQELIELFLTRWGSGEWTDLSCGRGFEPHEATFLKLDCTKANNLLDWYPVYGLSETIDATVDWYSKYYKITSKDIYSLTVEKIFNYIQKARSVKAVWT